MLYHDSGVDCGRFGHRHTLKHASQASRVCPDHSTGSLNSLGWVVGLLGEPGRAVELCRTGLAAFDELGDRWGLSQFMPVLAGALLRLGDADRSTRLLSAAEALREALGVPMAPYARPEYKRIVEAAGAALGDSGRFDAAMAEGRAMSQAEAVAYALADPTMSATPDRSADRPGPLTTREIEVAALVAQGCTNPETRRDW